MCKFSLAKQSITQKVDLDRQRRTTLQFQMMFEMNHDVSKIRKTCMVLLTFADPKKEQEVPPPVRLSL
jgi:hypothetical protein